MIYFHHQTKLWKLFIHYHLTDEEECETPYLNHICLCNFQKDLSLSKIYRLVIYFWNMWKEQNTSRSFGDIIISWKDLSSRYLIFYYMNGMYHIWKNSITRFLICNQSAWYDRLQYLPFKNKIYWKLHNPLSIY